MPVLAADCHYTITLSVHASVISPAGSHKQQHVMLALL
jgi:hypothetical protein